MAYTADFVVNANKLNTDDPVLVLMDIEHPFIDDTIRLINDNMDIVSLSNRYLSMPFDIKRQSDVQNELPRITVVIQNVGRSIVKWIDSSGGGRNAKIKIKLVRRSTPDIIEETLELAVATVTITTETILLNLIIQNNLNKRSCRLTFDVYRALGLF